MSLNMDEKIMIKNLCDWNLYFKRINGVGDVALPPKTSYRIDRGEVISQIQNNNVFFVGTDGIGSHARIFIDDKDTRVEVGFETDSSEQNIITDEKVKAAFALKSKTAFKKAIEELAQSYAEKVTLVGLIKKLGLNEYDKIKIIETYTGIKVED